MSSGFDPNPVRLLRQWRKLFWLGVGVAVFAAADALLTRYGPEMRMAAVETGASFSVSAGSFATEAKATTFAAALDASGLPILVRMRPDDSRYQVLVGPYVSTDEAEHAQRKLAAWGLGEARFVVDDTMRGRPQEAAVFGFGEQANNSVVMLAAPGMASIVFEMGGAPTEVESRRTSSTSVDVVIGRTQPAAPSEQLRLPDGVSLVQGLFVHGEGDGAMLAHVVVPQGVEDRLRLEGRRVYLDLAFPKAPWSIAHRPPGGRVLLDPPDRPVTHASDGHEELKAAAARFEQIKPFFVSAIESPEADVLAALTHSLDDLRASVEKLTVSGDVESERVALLTAITSASEQIKKAGGLSTTGPSLSPTP